MSKIIVCNTLYIFVWICIYYGFRFRFHVFGIGTMFSGENTTIYKIFSLEHVNSELCNFRLVYYHNWMLVTATSFLFRVYGKLCRYTKIAENLYNSVKPHRISVRIIFRQHWKQQLLYLEQYKLVEFNSYW